jgi:hypothetical protein
LEFFSETTSVCLAAPAPIPPLPSKMNPGRSTFSFLSLHLTLTPRSPSVAAPLTVTGVVSPAPVSPQTTFNLKQAPVPVGAYAHAKVAGGLLFLAGNKRPYSLSYPLHTLSQVLVLVNQEQMPFQEDQSVTLSPRSLWLVHLPPQSHPSLSRIMTSKPRLDPVSRM